MAGYEAIIDEEANREIDSWPEDAEFRTTEPMMRVTLNVILRAVFGTEGKTLSALRERAAPGDTRLATRAADLPPSRPRAAESVGAFVPCADSTKSSLT